MTIQQAKQELTDYRQDAVEIRNRKDEIYALESRLYSGCGGNMENGVIALITMKEYYKNLELHMAECDVYGQNEKIEILRSLGKMPRSKRSV